MIQCRDFVYYANRKDRLNSGKVTQVKQTLDLRTVSKTVLAFVMISSFSEAGVLARPPEHCSRCIV